jgi:endonuclease YncB( thermonuclease family)
MGLGIVRCESFFTFKWQPSQNALSSWRGDEGLPMLVQKQKRLDLLGGGGPRVISARIHPGWLLVVALAAFTAVLIVIQRIDHAPSVKAGASVSTTIQAQPPVTASKPLTGIARVIDGDTIAIHGTHIRLNGIDAPETKQSCEISGKLYQCGQQSTEALIAFLGGRSTECTEVSRDRYQRVVARCQVNSIDVGNWMVEHGWAVAYRKYSTDYIEAERRAQTQKLGIWAGTFTLPEEWRRTKAMEKTNVQR